MLRMRYARGHGHANGHTHMGTNICMEVKVRGSIRGGATVDVSVWARLNPEPVHVHVRVQV